MTISDSTELKSQIQIDNVLEKGVLHSGFIIGSVHSNSEVALIEVRIDCGSYNSS